MNRPDLKEMLEQLLKKQQEATTVAMASIRDYSEDDKRKIYNEMIDQKREYLQALGLFQERLSLLENDSHDNIINTQAEQIEQLSKKCQTYELTISKLATAHQYTTELALYLLGALPVPPRVAYFIDGQPLKT